MPLVYQEEFFQARTIGASMRIPRPDPSATLRPPLPLYAEYDAVGNVSDLRPRNMTQNQNQMM